MAQEHLRIQVPGIDAFEGHDHCKEKEEERKKEKARIKPP